MFEHSCKSLSGWAPGQWDFWVKGHVPSSFWHWQNGQGICPPISGEGEPPPHQMWRPSSFPKHPSSRVPVHPVRPWRCPHSCGAPATGSVFSDSALGSGPALGWCPWGCLSSQPCPAGSPGLTGGGKKKKQDWGRAQAQPGLTFKSSMT